jgi:hypothetical protein
MLRIQQDLGIGNKFFALNSKAHRADSALFHTDAQF